MPHCQRDAGDSPVSCGIGIRWYRSGRNCCAIRTNHHTSSRIDLLKSTRFLQQLFTVTFFALKANVTLELAATINRA